MKTCPNCSLSILLPIPAWPFWRKPANSSKCNLLTETSRKCRVRIADELNNWTIVGLVHSHPASLREEAFRFPRIDNSGRGREIQSTLGLS